MTEGQGARMTAAVGVGMAEMGAGEQGGTGLGAALFGA